MSLSGTTGQPEAPKRGGNDSQLVVSARGDDGIGFFGENRLFDDNYLSCFYGQAKVSTMPLSPTSVVRRTRGASTVSVVATVSVPCDPKRGPLPPPPCRWPGSWAWPWVPALTVALPSDRPLWSIISRRRGSALSSACRTSWCADENATLAWSPFTLSTTCIGPRSGGFS